MLFLIAFAGSSSAQTATNHAGMALAPAHDELRLAPAYGEIPPTFWESYGTAVLVGGLVLLLALAGVIVWICFRPRSSTAAPPEVLARETLARLLGQPEDRNVLSLTSQTLRRYLAAAFGFPAREFTTREFSAALAASDKVGAELAQMVSGFLRECDQRKFAPAMAGPPLNAVYRALEIISETEKRRAAVGVQPQPDHYEQR